MRAPEYKLRRSKRKNKASVAHHLAARGARSDAAIRSLHEPLTRRARAPAPRARRQHARPPVRPLARPPARSPDRRAQSTMRARAAIPPRERARAAARLRAQRPRSRRCVPRERARRQLTMIAPPRSRDIRLRCAHRARNAGAGYVTPASRRRARARSLRRRDAL
jgi:hypothetical protein